MHKEAIELDWSDPTKLQYRNGRKVVACGRFEKPDGKLEFWSVGECTYGSHAASGHFRTSERESDWDIIPKPEEFVEYLPVIENGLSIGSGVWRDAAGCRRENPSALFIVRITTIPATGEVRVEKVEEPC